MSPEPGPKELSTLSTLVLLNRASGGDERARNALYSRYLPRLQRWARGRLPHKARGLVDTDDLVQDTLLRTLAPHDRESDTARSRDSRFPRTPWSSCCAPRRDLTLHDVGSGVEWDRDGASRMGLMQARRLPAPSAAPGSFGGITTSSVG
jgi:hypothetical protein